MSALKIDDLINYLKGNQLSNTWINQHSWVIADQETSKLLVLNKILSVSSEILTHFTLFFLCGDYCISKPDIIKKNQDTLEAFLLERSQLIDITHNTSIENELQEFYINNVIDLVKNFIFSRLNLFDRDLNKQLQLENTKKLFRAQKKIDHKFSNDKIYQDYRIAFFKTVELTRLEHFDYLLVEKTIHKLLLLKKEVEMLTISDFIKEALTAKIDFLQAKLFYRNKERNDRLGNLSYSFDLQPDEVLNLSTIKLPPDLLDWDNSIKIHYGLVDDFKPLQRKKVANIYSRYSDGMSIDLFLEYRLLIKKFKDDTVSSVESEILFLDFKQKSLLRTTEFDIYAQKVTLLYLFNNNISLKLNSHLSIFEFTSIFHDIRNHQNDYEIKNYFPWKKLCDTLSIKIEYLIENLADKEKFSLFQQLLSLYSSTIDKLNETLEWSTEKSFLPFQLTFEECKSDYTINTGKYGDIKLFFFSSQVLPLCYESIKKDANQLNLNKLKYETLFSTYKRLRTVIEDVEETSLKLRNQERRSIEVIAIFSAISLFSVGSIQIFSKEIVVSDPNVYYKFIFSYGYSLILFVLVIWVITRDNIKKVQTVHWVIIITLILSSLFVIGYFVGSPSLLSIFKQ